VKYILFEYPKLKGIAVPVIFPEVIEHKHMQLPEHKLHGLPVAVSAGFVNSAMQVSGQSIGLKLASRPQDAEHIRKAFTFFGE
jgi:hypothetical protein